MIRSGGVLIHHSSLAAVLVEGGHSEVVAVQADASFGVGSALRIFWFHGTRRFVNLYRKPTPTRDVERIDGDEYCQSHYGGNSERYSPKRRRVAGERPQKNTVAEARAESKSAIAFGNGVGKAAFVCGTGTPFRGENQLSVN